MILVLGGTEDSRQLTNLLTEAGYQVVVSVVTNYGRELAHNSGITTVIAGSLTSDKLEQFIYENKITAVIDATHPFATLITDMAFKVCNLLNIVYIRYERSETDVTNHKLVFPVATFEEGINKAASLPGPWFFTTGSKQLAQVINSEKFSLDHLYVRVLPDPKVIEHCYSIGLRAKNIIAIQGPISYEMNRITFQDLGIKTIITKDSGVIGGVPEKIKAGIDSNLNVIIIKRPEIIIPQNKTAETTSEIIRILEGEKLK